jgi:hypothetical protein
VVTVRAIRCPDTTFLDDYETRAADIMTQAAANDAVDSAVAAAAAAAAAAANDELRQVRAALEKLQVDHVTTRDMQ